jgi:hypothetical protein
MTTAAKYSAEWVKEARTIDIKVRIAFIQALEAERKGKGMFTGIRNQFELSYEAAMGCVILANKDKKEAGLR